MMHNYQCPAPSCFIKAQNELEEIGQAPSLRAAPPREHDQILRRPDRRKADCICRQSVRRDFDWSTSFPDPMRVPREAKESSNRFRASCWVTDGSFAKHCSHEVASILASSNAIRVGSRVTDDLSIATALGLGPMITVAASVIFIPCASLMGRVICTLP